MADQARPLRLDLTGPLAGHYIVIDEEKLDFGLLEDFDSSSVALTLDALAGLILEGDLPHGINRQGLRRLSVRRGETREVFRAIRAELTLSDPPSGRLLNG